MSGAHSGACICGAVTIEARGAPRVNGLRAILPTLHFKPSVHPKYEETVLPVKDGLPKLRDFPAEIGSSGETMSE